jgi:hypothetical protein
MYLRWEKRTRGSNDRVPTLQDFPEFCGHFRIIGIYAGIRDADVLKIGDAARTTLAGSTNCFYRH